jgi:hypothetical protein
MIYDPAKRDLELRDHIIESMTDESWKNTRNRPPRILPTVLLHNIKSVSQNPVLDAVKLQLTSSRCAGACLRFDAMARSIYRQKDVF